MVKITYTTIRDGHQPVPATRMRTEDMLPISAQIDEAGFHNVEISGGATFELFKKTPLQMLLL